MDAETATLPIHSVRALVPGEHAQALDIYTPVAEAIRAISPTTTMTVFGDPVGFSLNVRNPQRESFSIRVWAPPFDMAGENLWIVHYGDLTCEDGTYEHFDTDAAPDAIAEAVTNLLVDGEPVATDPHQR